MDAPTLYGRALSERKKYVPPWKQDARGADGRKRFHGAFTGGFSAGYYNTVGSREGWEPAAFTSSRKARSAPLTSSVSREEYMDAEDGDDYLGMELVFCRRSTTGQDPLSTVLDTICSMDNAIMNSMGFSSLGNGKGTPVADLIASTLNHHRQEARPHDASRACIFTEGDEIVSTEKSYPVIEVPEGFNPNQATGEEPVASDHPRRTARGETLTPEAAAKALRGFMPYEHYEPGKNERYKEFLRLVSSGMDVSQFGEEQQEFIRTGLIFQPLHGLMAEKFINARSHAVDATSGEPKPPTHFVHKHEHRRSIEWDALPLLKKRFGVEQGERQVHPCQRVEHNHDSEGEQDPLPARAGLGVLREIYSSGSSKRTESIVFRKPQPRHTK